MLNQLQISALDLRLSIMAGVLTVMALIFHIFTGNFLTPENLYNIAQQTAVVGIVAAAVALIIVARQIDLSVGSVMGVVGVLIAFLMYTHNWHWVPACLAGLAVALVIALYQGWLTAYLGVPSFVVTLGGLMSFRGAAFLVADGKTQPITDATFLLFGGGLDGSLGATWSWVLGAVLAALLLWNTVSRRRNAVAHGFPLRPAWFDLAVTGFFIVVLLAFVATMNAYVLADKGAGQGVPIPVLIWALVVMGMAFIVNRTRFGRYVYAIGGNEEATRLSGVAVRFHKTAIYGVSGVMSAIAAIVLTARLNSAQPIAGTMYELDAIAATVIGGTSLMGGEGTLAGTLVGALIMGVLRNGLNLLGVSSFLQQIVIGGVIVGAVLVDTVLKRRKV